MRDTISVKSPKPKQNSLRARKYAITCAALLAVVVAGCSIVAYTRRQSIRERWLKGQSLETLRSLDAQTDADTLVHYVLAMRLMSQKMPEGARRAAAEATKSISDSDRSELTRRVLALTAYLDARYGKEIDAESSVDLAEHMGGDEALTRLAKGVLAVRHKQLAQAISEFTAATRLDPLMVETWSRLAAALTLVAEPNEAIGAYRRAVELAPDDAQVHADLAEGLGGLFQYSEAAKECARAAELAPNDPALAVLPAVARASSARDDTEYDEAVQMLASAIQQFPQLDFLHELVAGLHMRFGQYPQARAELQQFLTGNPTDAGSWLNLNAVCEKLGDYRTAKAAFAKYDELMHEQSQTAELARQALMHSDDPDIFVKLSAAYHRTGKLRQAYAAILHASEIRPMDPKISRAATDLQSEMNQTADAPSRSGAGLTSP